MSAHRRQRLAAWLAGLSLLLPGCAVLGPEPPPAAQVAPPDYPFDPSPEDLAGLDAAGFSEAVTPPAGAGFDLGLTLTGVHPGGALGRAGLADGDLLVAIDGMRFSGDVATALRSLNARLAALRPGQSVTVRYVRGDDRPREARVTLGRRPPRFDALDTPSAWFRTPPRDLDRAALINRLLALGPGRAAYHDALTRNRGRFATRDAFLLQPAVQAHFNLDANERLADDITERIADDPANALAIATAAPVVADGAAPRYGTLSGLSLEALTDRLQATLARAASGVASAREDWTAEEVAAFPAYFHGLHGRLAEGPFVHGDPSAERERHNRRMLRLLARTRKAVLHGAAAALLRDLQVLLPHLEHAARSRAARAGGGLLLSRETPVGRLEVWGTDPQTHTTRAAFRLDLGGNDRYLDVGGRADLEHPVAVSVDLAGDDLYGATSPGAQGAGIAGIGVLMDRAGDDQYVARHWSQGVGVGGFGLLLDAAGDDVYRSLSLAQGVGLAGAGVLADGGGDDQYTGLRYTQGVGLAGGVGALTEGGGDDRYVCVGRDPSAYGEDGLFAGWGQGAGVGFRHVTSGGIGVLHDRDGDDVYEGGNFSQGGGYHYAWGILRDDAGDDRYIGARYAQGFAAHQSQATFIEGGGNDHYQSLSTVANGLSWDETSVVFHDHGGDDVYETHGFSLGAAAHNGMVLFLDSGGDDVYPTVPGRAGPNDYHGGHSIAFSVDLGGGRDRYGDEEHGAWNDRVSWKGDVGYVADLPDLPADLSRYVRD